MGHLRTTSRRRHAALVGTVTAGLLAGTALVAAPAQAATPTSFAQVGLYGTTDPTYDGVFRQSLAVLGLHAA
ncbi:MAG: hypothetical protein JWR85_3401, partial [Marmoricola sp.]|nr:hypothetical protein [Marmoricola sp.]